MFDPAVWAGWDYRATIVNDGINSGNHAYNVSPGEGNIVVLLGGHVFNGDASARTIAIVLRNADDNTIRHVLPGVSVAAGNRRQFPTSQTSGDEGTASSPPIPTLSGPEDLDVSVASVAVSQDTEFVIHALVFDGPPTVTLTSPTGATETESENRIV